MKTDRADDEIVALYRNTSESTKVAVLALLGEPVGREDEEALTDCAATLIEIAASLRSS